MSTRFVVIAAPRTGSNWLCTLLDSHPEVLCHHELFNPAGIHLALSRRGRLDFGGVADRDRDPGALIARVWRTDFGCRAVGFKLNRGQSPAAFEAVFADRSLSVILLRRRNRLRTLVSERLAQESGNWESYTGQTTCAGSVVNPTPPALALTAAELAAHAAANDAYYRLVERRLASGGQVCFHTEYERLADVAERRRLLAFLGVDATLPLTAGTRKQGPRELRAVIANFDRLRLDLVATPFAADLELPEPPTPTP